MFNQQDFIAQLEARAESLPTLYEEGEHPSELLQSINNKLDKEDTIIENQKVQISELKQQNYKLQEQIDFAKHEAQQANLKAAKSEQKSKISITIAIFSVIADIIIAVIPLLR